MRQIRPLSAWLLALPPEVDALRLAAGARPNLAKVGEVGFIRDEEEAEGWAEAMAEELLQQLEEAEPGAPCIRVQALAGARTLKTWTKTDDDPAVATIGKTQDPTLVLVTGIRNFLDVHVSILKVYGDTIERMSLSTAQAIEERDAARMAELEAHGELARLAAGGGGGDEDGPLKEQAAELLGELVGRVKQKGPLTPEKLAEALEKNPKAAARYANNPRLREAFLKAMAGGGSDAG